MNVRLGTYTVFKGIEMTVTEYYGHGLSQEIDKSHRVVSYSNDLDFVEGFKEKEGKFYKDVHLSEITNAFLVVTITGFSSQHSFNSHSRRLPRAFKSAECDFAGIGYCRLFHQRGANGIITTATKAITKSRLPNEFVDALKIFGKSEDEILTYFTDYHNLRSNNQFLNEIEEYITSMNAHNLTRAEAFSLWGGGHKTSSFEREINM